MSTVRTNQFHALITQELRVFKVVFWLTNLS